MSANDVVIMNMASQSGISVCLVTKPSKNPAIIKKGTVLSIILRPFLTPRLKDSNRVYVPGKSIPFAKTSPAHPAMMITEISMVP